MFQLSDFYEYCKGEHISVVPFDESPSPGVTMQYKNKFAIFLDFSQMKSVRLVRGVCMHELGHAATGALHKVYSPYETVERNEHKAIKWAAEKFLTADDFRAAFADGYTELWELAEYFDLPEQDVEKAYQYWTECRGVDFNKEIGDE